MDAPSATPETPPRAAGTARVIEEETKGGTVAASLQSWVVETAAALENLVGGAKETS